MGCPSTKHWASRSGPSFHGAQPGAMHTAGAPRGALGQPGPGPGAAAWLAATPPVLWRSRFWRVRDGLSPLFSTTSSEDHDNVRLILEPPDPLGTQLIALKQEAPGAASLEGLFDWVLLELGGNDGYGLTFGTQTDFALLVVTRDIVEFGLGQGPQDRGFVSVLDEHTPPCVMCRVEVGSRTVEQIATFDPDQILLTMNLGPDGTVLLPTGSATLFRTDGSSLNIPPTLPIPLDQRSVDMGALDCPAARPGPRRARGRSSARQRVAASQGRAGLLRRRRPDGGATAARARRSAFCPPSGLRSWRCV